MNGLGGAHGIIPNMPPGMEVFCSWGFGAPKAFCAWGAPLLPSALTNPNNRLANGFMFIPPYLFISMSSGGSQDMSGPMAA